MSKIVLKSLLGLLFSGVSSLGLADPVDGRYVQATKTTWNSGNYTWWQKIPPKDGGTLYFDKTQGADTNMVLNVNVDVQLGRIVLRNEGADYLTGKPLTMVGDRPCLTVENLARSVNYVVDGNATFGLVDTSMKGTGSNVFVQKGTDVATSNFILYNSCLTDFGSLELCDGTMTAWVRDGGVVASAAPIALGDYRLNVQAQQTEATTATSGALAVKGGSASLVLDKGAAPSLTYVPSALSIDAAEGSLAIVPKAGLAALGETEVLKLTTPPADGWISPAIVGAEYGGDGLPVKFLKYDNDKGLVVNKNATSISTATSISADVTYANGLTVDDAATLTLSNGAKLTIGDGTRPAGLAFNYGAAESDKTFLAATGNGVLDFGGQDAYIWFTCHEPANGNRTIQIDVPITNAKDVHLIARFWRSVHGSKYQFSQPIVMLASSGNSWSGNIYASGVRLHQSNHDQFPATSQIHITGGPKAGGGQLYQNIAEPISNELFLAGRGMYTADAAGAFNGAGGERKFDAPITLTGDTTINCQKNNLYLRNAIGGTGALTLTAVGDSSSPGNQIHLEKPSTYEGTTYIENVTIYLDGEGTFGMGPVVFRDATRGTSKIVFTRTNQTASVANDIAGGGSFYISSTLTNLTLAGTLDVNELVANYYDDNELTVQNAAADKVFARNDNVISAADGASVVLTGCDVPAESELRATLADGDGRLSFVKKGTNALALVGPQRYTGGTTVSNGVLRLVAQPDFPLRDRCSFHLDASDESTLTTDGDGFVSEWRTVEGGCVNYDVAAPKMVAAGECAYTKEAFGKPKYVASEAFGGRKVVRFSTNAVDRLVQSRATKNRSVFIVANIVGTCQYGGFFGKHGYDFGLRMATGTSPSSFTDINGHKDGGYAFYVTDGSLFCNGVKTTSFERGKAKVFSFGRFPFVVDSANTRDESEKVTFKFSLGGYLNNSYGADILAACRPVGYEVAEVIILKDNVSDADRQRVEDYLAQKWLGAPFGGSTFTPQAGVLNPAGALTIAEGATLDLNGVSQTAASLSGVGTIVNTSATPATLTVTGASDFTGEVTGDVKLVLSDGTAALHLTDGASLGTTGAGGADGAAILPYVGYPHALPTNGIVYWLDAALSESVIRDENGFVTNWVTRAPGTVSFNSANNPVAKFLREGLTIPPPVYRTGDQGWGTRKNAGVYFGASTNDPKVATLRSEKTCKVKTIFLVHATDGSANYNVCPGIWSPNCGGDCGIRWSGQGQSSLDFCGYAFYFFYGDSVRINGTEKIATATGVPGSSAEKQFYLSGRAVGAWHTEAAATHALGCYLDSYLPSQNPRGMKGWISEVIAYDRVLTDEETAYVEEYLREKWFTDEGLPEIHTSIFGDDAAKTLTVKVSEDKTVSPLTIAGDFDATGWTLFVDDYRDLGKRNPMPAVPVVRVVDGEASGTFSTNVTEPWYLDFASESGWSLGYNLRGLLLLVK